MSLPTLFHCAASGLLLSLATSCQPTNGLDPLDHGGPPAVTIAKVPSLNPQDEDRLLHEHTVQRAHESPHGTAMGSQAGTTVTAEW
ncbi:hypothetical protein [Luteolibacter luteus]|uniref:Uncharacterized protein n=1 Tax=Luteolibacter luteus TaxID=2728835 RepID=A0A858RK73_9BACT|nr:hypothetical protein [Luteolibacter luteus]QJE97696.1 hypothetical protein HHL09_18550 [Luteolibacter luteus]